LGGPLPKLCPAFDEKRARTPRWVIRFTSKLQVNKKIDQRVEPPDTFLEENHPIYRLLGASSCNLQSRARTHAIVVIGLYELLGNPTT
jgi:hypothetical protein